MAMSSELEGLLAQWLPRQTWFPVTSSDLIGTPDVVPMSDTQVFELDFPVQNDATLTVQGWIAIVSVGSGENTRRVSVPLTLRTREDEPMRAHLIGQIDDFMLGPCYVYDAVADPVFVLFAATAMATGNASFALGRDAAFDDLHATKTRGDTERGDAERKDPMSEAAAGMRSDSAEVARPVSVSDAFEEQLENSDHSQLTALSVGSGGREFMDLTNIAVLWHRATTTQLKFDESRRGETAVLIDDHAFPSVLTFFRVLDTSDAPESVRLPIMLTIAESQAVAPVLGWMAARWFDGTDLQTHSAPVAMLTRSETSAQSAWNDAVKAAVNADGSYVKRAHDLGGRAATLHVDMGRELGKAEGTGKPTADWVSKWTDRVDWALARAPLALNPVESKLRAHKKWLKDLGTVGNLQRIHGELTLNHVVKAPVNGFTVANFSESDELRPPTFDLVALLRSIDYAAGYAFLKRTGALDPKAAPSTLGATGLVDDELVAEVNSAPETRWSHDAQQALLAGYSHVGGADFSLKDPVLRAMLVDRLLVEVVSELRNRPTWLIVPLSELTRVLSSDVEVAKEPARLNPRTSTEANRAGIEERLAAHRKAQEEKVAHARAAAAKAREENARLVAASEKANKDGQGVKAQDPKPAETPAEEDTTAGEAEDVVEDTTADASENKAEEATENKADDVAENKVDDVAEQKTAEDEPQTAPEEQTAPEDASEGEDDLGEPSDAGGPTDTDGDDADEPADTDGDDEDTDEHDNPPFAPKSARTLR